MNDWLWNLVYYHFIDCISIHPCGGQQGLHIRNQIYPDHLELVSQLTSKWISSFVPFLKESRTVIFLSTNSNYPILSHSWTLQVGKSAIHWQPRLVLIIRCPLYIDELSIGLTRGIRRLIASPKMRIWQYSSWWNTMKIPRVSGLSIDANPVEHLWERCGTSSRLLATASLSGWAFYCGKRHGTRRATKRSF